MPKARFPFTYIGKTKLGKIYRPYAQVEITSFRIDEWIPIEVVIDTGADYTLLSRRYAPLLGIEVMKDCISETTLGVGGSETIYLLKNPKIAKKIGESGRKLIEDNYAWEIIFNQMNKIYNAI